MLLKKVEIKNHGEIMDNLIKVQSRNASSVIKKVITINDRRSARTAHTKTRGQLAYSRKKMHAQKGTGRARVDERNSPMLRGGAVAHGPKTLLAVKKINKRERQLALPLLINYMHTANQVIVVKNIEVTGKTRDTIKFLNHTIDSYNNRKVVILMDKHTKNILLSTRNINVDVMDSESLDITKISKAHHVIIEETLLKKMRTKYETN